MPPTRRKQPASSGTIEDRAPNRHIRRVHAMLDRHIENSLWLKSRSPLLLALADLALEQGSTDSVRIRALEKIEEMLEKAEDEKRRETFGTMEEGIEASIRRLEGAIRRRQRNN